MDATQWTHRNTCIVANLRALWRKVLRTRPGEVSLKHVRSHTGLPGNDLADWLADMAADRQKEVDIASAEQWLTNWIAERKRQGTAGGGGQQQQQSPTKYSRGPNRDRVVFFSLTHSALRAQRLPRCLLSVVLL